jgi:small subunit ribosomal protein S1
MEDRTPLAGSVRGTNKGGYTIDLGGRRAFCPHSQMDLFRVEDPDAMVGLDLTFRIIELSEDGRNIVLSRRAVLEEEREQKASKTRATLAVGDVLEGKVTRLAPFGAFVDLGGLEGLVHVSQISHQRIESPNSLLKVGQEVKVQVLEIQNLGEGRRERISLSMKALATDPWPESARQFEVGQETDGKVTRLTNFGAFVELQPGVEGLVHISELSTRRVFHPREIVQEGQEIPVRVLNIDLDRRRISLSLKQSTRWDGE